MRLFLRGLVLLAVLLQASPVFGDSSRGLGAWFGTAGHDFSALQLDGTEYRYTSQGKAIQMDYRAPLNPFITAAGLLILTIEDAQEETAVRPPMDQVSLTQFGGEIRFWWNAFYVGGQYSLLSQGLYYLNDPVPVSSGGSALSLIAGLEIQKGWGIMAQFIQGQLEDDQKTRYDISGYRLMLGYHFGADQR